eukprot:TRINITY_DN5970_c0_g1_i14.p2 TRINITY_DN5970_c0_g1~~TRINITY_DN5970_c0_g1_i14.p2  ORF type:complete len:129 (+),score=4.46 TRINITY_DN5970_c0_g1_i14:59-388(+)
MANQRMFLEQYSFKLLHHKQPQQNAKIGQLIITFIIPYKKRVSISNDCQTKTSSQSYSKRKKIWKRGNIQKFRYLLSSTAWLKQPQNLKILQPTSATSRLNLEKKRGDT